MTSRGPLRIAWLLSIVGPGSGGLFNIFRVIHQLEQWGHDNRIYLTGRTALSGSQATAIMRKHYFPVKAEVKIFNGQIEDSDSLVSTLWTTAYAARGVGNTAGKFYFVQDLETLFYPEGSLCEFARQTYTWGFYGITAGQWIADVLRREFGMNSSAYGFSYDRDTYSSSGTLHLPTPKKRVLLYVRPHTERRGFEMGMLALSIVARRMPEVDFVLVGYPLRRSEVPFPAVIAGKMSVSELPALYRSCTVAMVLSHTNLSLLPLELMACGCPVVSNRGPNVEWLLRDDVAQLADRTPESLAEALLALLQDDRLRANKAAAGLAFAQSTSWEREIRAIESAFYRGLNLERAAEHNG